jgi:hypothetical protein
MGHFLFAGIARQKNNRSRPDKRRLMTSRNEDNKNQMTK